MGFMLPNGNSANKRDKALKSSRRQKFNGNHSEKGILDQSKHDSIENTHTQEQVDAERSRIAKRYKNQRLVNWIIFVLTIPLVGYLMYLGIFWLLDYNVTL
jgi:hypothetical protein